MARTTAQQRELARLYEGQGRYDLAAACWQVALDLYPATPGQLAERDRSLIRERIAGCLQAHREMQRGAA